MLSVCNTVLADTDDCIILRQNIIRFRALLPAGGGMITVAQPLLSARKSITQCTRSLSAGMRGWFPTQGGEARTIPTLGNDTTGGVDMVRQWFSVSAVLAVAV